MKYIGWRYFCCCYRPFCDRWWKHWFNIRLLWWDIKDAWNRAFRGWGDGDIWDLMTYHTGITIGLLEHFKKNHYGYAGDDEDEYKKKIDLAIDGWMAKWRILNDTGWSDESDNYEEWRKPLDERWARGISAFIDIYDSLWI